SPAQSRYTAQFENLATRDLSPAARRAMAENDLLDALRLNLVPGIGSRLQTQLLATFGTPAKGFAAPGEQLLQVEGIGPKLSAAISAARSSPEAQRELDRCRQARVELLRIGDEAYPALLAKI